MEAHATLPSTNERALQWAEGGTPEGSTVVADHQTDGRGRQGRGWQARSGQSLTFSVILRPGGSSRQRAAWPARLRRLLPLAGGLAVCEAVAEVAGAPAPRLKWPNDVLLEGRKCCGVLAETVSTGSAAGPVVLGIGLNVGQRGFPGVPDEATPPTSLLLAAGPPAPERAALLADVLARLEARYDALLTGKDRSVRDACTERLANRGKRVAVRRLASGERVTGTVRGLAPDGALRLQTSAGTERTLRAGDVTVMSE
jgi:BirA family biotin operon repressor/biotin-[acetyl-CoA-carboxylase] ligase